jgi:hypothetical protein
VLILDLHTGNNLQDLCNYETVLETGGCFRYLNSTTKKIRVLKILDFLLEKCNNNPVLLICKLRIFCEL